MRLSIAVCASLAIVTGCSRTPVAPASLATAGSVSTSGSATAAKPGYESAYYNGTTVTINAIEVAQNTGPLTHAAADFYEVVYPTNHALWPSAPMCNPCDHQGNGIDPSDYHDHLLDSIPSDPGHGEYNALWHVFVVVPSSPAAEAAYAARLPMKSEAAVDDAIAAGVAREIDTSFYFLCAVVSASAVH